MKIKVKIKTSEGSYTRKFEISEENSDITISQFKELSDMVNCTKQDLKIVDRDIQTTMVSIETEW